MEIATPEMRLNDQALAANDVMPSGTKRLLAPITIGKPLDIRPRKTSAKKNGGSEEAANSFKSKLTAKLCVACNINFPSKPFPLKIHHLFLFLRCLYQPNRCLLHFPLPFPDQALSLPRTLLFCRHLCFQSLINGISSTPNIPLTLSIFPVLSKKGDRPLGPLGEIQGAIYHYRL